MAYNFSDGVALVSLATHTDENKWTYIDKQGNRLFDKEFELANSFSEGYAVVLKEGYAAPLPTEVPRRWAYIDKTGEFVTKSDFEEAYDFKGGYAIVKNNGKYGVIDKGLNLVIPYEYDDCMYTDDNEIFYVQENESKKFIDITGQTVGE